MSKAISDWLTLAYLNWQQEVGGRRTITEFAEFIGVPQSSLSNWMGGRVDPKGRSIGILASKLGSGIYRIMGIELPDSLPPDVNLLINSLSDQQLMEWIKIGRDLLSCGGGTVDDDGETNGVQDNGKVTTLYQAPGRPDGGRPV